AILSARIGWSREAEVALRRLPEPPARARLELAAALVTRGERHPAMALLEAVERESGARLEADEWLDGAMTWYQCRRPDRGAAWARRGVAAMGGHIAARALLARCLLAAGQPEAALQAVGKAAVPRPLVPSRADPLLEYWHARAGLRAGDAGLRAESTKRLAHLGTHDPPNAVAAFEAGRAFLQAGGAATAIPLLLRAAAEGYQQVLADELLAEAYGRVGQPAEAARARGRALRARGRFPEAEAVLRRALSLDPASSGAYAELGQVLILAGKPREALAVLRRGRRRDPANLNLALGEADALNQLDAFDEQTRVLKAAVALDATRAHEPLRALGKMYYETRQFDAAIPVLERAVGYSDSDVESHRFLGLCLALRPEDPSHAERALHHLLRAVELEPDDYYPWTRAGAVLERRGYPGEAAACYRRAILWDNWAEAPYVPLARLLQRKGRPAEATLLLTRYRANADFERRRVQLENRIQSRRTDADAHFQMGEQLLRHVSFRRAYPYLLIAASWRPHWKAARERLADVCALIDYLDLWHDAEHAPGERAPKALLPEDAAKTRPARSSGSRRRSGPAGCCASRPPRPTAASAPGS
ncbi:MAG: tetratricopeptide repeat protein, partial [Chloroflexi bacterium]|nr:tetratricopeptide repeat protein [Chloroflexota bacterium]